MALTVSGWTKQNPPTLYIYNLFLTICLSIQTRVSMIRLQHSDICLAEFYQDGEDIISLNISRNKICQHKINMLICCKCDDVSVKLGVPAHKEI